MMQPVSDYKTASVLTQSDLFVDKPEESCEFSSVRQCSSEKHVTEQKGVCERDIKLADDVLRMLSFNLGRSWITVANEVGFSEDEIKELQSLYTPRKNWKVKFNDLLTSSNNKTWHTEISDPKITEVIPLFISRALKKINVDVFFNAIEKTNYHLAKCARKIQLEATSKKQDILAKTADQNSKFSSYIFLQWVKLPGRSTTWGHIIPNTEILPHQQTVYDWAFLNKDKIVVLWFDSYNLTDEEIRQYYNFESKVEPAVDNILVLDIRDVDWSNVSLLYYDKFSSGPPVESMTTKQVLEKQKFTSLGDRVDYLRERLLYEGSFAVASALRKTNKRLEVIDCLPSRGVYLDLDFIPRKFDSSEVHHKSVCIDDSLRNVSSYTTSYGGTVRFGGHFSNSLIAVNQDHLDILGEYLRIDFNDDCLPYYTGLLNTLTIFRDSVDGTRNFRMNGSLHLYRGDFLPEWAGKHGGTWKAEGQTEVNTQKNIPLDFRETSKIN